MWEMQLAGVNGGFYAVGAIFVACTLQQSVVAVQPFRCDGKGAAPVGLARGDTLKVRCVGPQPQQARTK